MVTGATVWTDGPPYLPPNDTKKHPLCLRKASGTKVNYDD